MVDAEQESSTERTYDEAGTAWAADVARKPVINRSLHGQRHACRHAYGKVQVVQVTSTCRGLRGVVGGGCVASAASYDTFATTQIALKEYIRKLTNA